MVIVVIIMMIRTLELGGFLRMDAATLWQRYQDWLYYHGELGFYLDISRMRFTDDFVQEMQPKFAQAFQAMIQVEQGAIANPDENRMVGHYWLRNPDLAPNAAIKTEITSTLEQILTFSQQVHRGELRPNPHHHFTEVLSVGIGGSALGPEFVAAALAPYDPAMELHFIDNTDPEGIDRTLHHLQGKLANTLVLIISKSGGTPETRNGMIEVKQAFASQGLDFARHAVAITGADSLLDKTAKSEGWLATFPMFDWVGGRTSQMSAVGLLPAALQGIDIQQLLAGAKIMDDATRIPQLRENPAALLALSWYYAGKGKGEKDMVILPYKDSLLLFSRYLQQLVMESLGKEKDLDGNTVYQGIAVYGNKGSTDQHAYVQQLREGVPNFFMTFIEVLLDRTGTSPEVEPGATSGDYLSGLLLGTRQALYENQRDSITITIPQVTPQAVGALIALYDRAVGIYASLVNINAYHQPGVEAGKKAAAAVLDVQKRLVEALKNSGSSLSLPELAQMAKAYDQIETVYQILRHLAANHRYGIYLEGNPAQPSSLKVSIRHS